MSIYRYAVLSGLGLSMNVVLGAIAAASPATVNPIQPWPIMTSSLAQIMTATDWSTLSFGETIADLTFSEDAALLLQREVILPRIPVSYRDNSPTTYAMRLLISPLSPTSRYSIVKACDSPQPQQGLCWSIYVVDRRDRAAQKVNIGKYGGVDWVQWSPDDRYAIFLEKMEGTSWFIALDLASGESFLLTELAAEARLSQFRWTSDRAFTVPLADGSNFLGDLALLFPGQ